MVRLAFSVMIQVDAEILLIDEVLAVGDAAFQQKCFDEFERIQRSGTTVLLVTHDMGAVAALLRPRDAARARRRRRARRPRATSATRYLELNFSEQARAPRPRPPTRRGATPSRRPTPRPRPLGDGRAEIVEAWFEDEDGARTDDAAHGRARARSPPACASTRTLEDPLFGVDLRQRPPLTTV